MTAKCGRKPLYADPGYDSGYNLDDYDLEEHDPAGYDAVVYESG